MNIIQRLGVRAFIKEVSKDVKVKFQKWDMECDVDEETVYIGKIHDKNTDKYFLNFLKEIAPGAENYNIFLMSILHEIGHIMTWDEDDANNKDILYGALRVMYQENKNDEEYNNMYFRIPLEYNATMWGIEFAQTHQELMKKYAWLKN